MPSIMFFISKIFLWVSWGVQVILITYMVLKIHSQQSNWINNAETLYVSQKKFKKVSYLIFLFLILISIWNFDINNEACFSCLSKWYKYNAIFGFFTFLCFAIIKVLTAIYKTEKYYEPSIKSFTNQKMLNTVASITMCYLMSRITQP